MNTARDHADFVSGVTAAMHRLIPADVCHVHAIDRARGRIMHHAFPASPFTADEVAYYVDHPQENPLVAHFERTGDKHARRLSDVTNVAAFHHTEFFRRCLRRVGFLHTLALPVAVDASTVAALVFDRRRPNFTRRHCELLDAFAPHFRLAWQHHAAPWRERPAGVPPARQQLARLGLTPREADVLFWMTEGKQNREIAAILARSLATVQEHVGNIVRKLDQENRHAATVFALRHLNRR
jgi:DNA-binding CsgD family transcriptional regulator